MVLFVQIVLRNAQTSLQILRTIQEQHQSRGVDHAGDVSPPLLISLKSVHRTFSGKCVGIKVFKSQCE